MITIVWQQTTTVTTTTTTSRTTNTSTTCATGNAPFNISPISRTYDIILLFLVLPLFLFCLF
jgi:hypothetical protein